MKRFLLLALLLVPISPSAAKPLATRCPGETTVEMRNCAEQSWQQSDNQLRRKISKQQYKQWQDATRALCAQAYGPYKEGTIYPQLVVGCDDHLNRALLKEFQPLGN
jgi:hypothetical protein